MAIKFSFSISFLSSSQNELMAHLFENFDEERDIISDLQRYFDDDNLFHSDYNFSASYTNSDDIIDLADDMIENNNDLSDEAKADYLFRLIFSHIDERYSFLPETLHQPNGDIIDNIDKYFDEKYSRLLELMNEDYELITAEIDI